MTDKMFSRYYSNQEKKKPIAEVKMPTEEKKVLISCGVKKMDDTTKRAIKRCIEAKKKDTPVTIRKNAFKKIDTIFSQGKEFKSYTLDNNFSGESFTPRNEGLKNDVESGTARLTYQGNGEYDIHYHGNHWIRFKSKEMK